ncbi:hypothetical protein J6I90_06545 [Pseudidiomarina sp. 1APP75-32.1]|uniref:Uncharacterized protein n=1 Tax=Pseudidiomarina terrestris TaxID=2820060 RepID=A0AAW7QWC1_9GAMM|nr:MULTISPECIES: hypothetical protein [unclassified Pseudidiomarina]MDN7124535.1 hypothetical protein [Pseudidiomarina sp. 1APP75-32.1]MDN7129174.1 hypothetical protein [Pseudidiomarina sp. 1APR75-15]
MDNISSINFSDNRTKTRLLIFSVLVLIISWITLIDKVAIDYVDNALAQATIAFASARVANALISTLQTVTLDIFVAQVAVGEVLSPLHNMIEDFSNVMKAALVSLLLQKLLVEIVSEFAFNTILSISAIFFAGTLILNKSALHLAAFKVFLTLAALRYLVIFIVMANGIVSSLFLDRLIEEQTAEVMTIEDSVRSIENSTPEITPELREQLEAGISKLETELGVLQDRESNLSLQLRSSYRTLSDYEAQIEALRARLSMSERLNPLSSNPELDALKDKASKTEVKIDEINDQLEENRDRQEDVLNDIATFRAELRGEPTGMLDSVSRSVSGVADKVMSYRNTFKYDNIKGVMTDAIDSMIKAVVPFVLKTILLPLLFLFLFSKIFKFIWNIDLNLSPQRSKRSDGEKPLPEQEPSNA